jgi:hypothetical protein
VQIEEHGRVGRRRYLISKIDAIKHMSLMPEAMGYVKASVQYMNKGKRRQSKLEQLRASNAVQRKITWDTFVSFCNEV